MIEIKEALSFASIALIALAVPFVLILTTSFTRISIILTFLKQALSTSVPSNQIVIGLSLVLTGYVMQPVFKEIQQKTSFTKALEGGEQFEGFLKEAWPPLRNFMLTHTREKDLELFLDLAHVNVATVEEIPWYCTIPSFALSELRTAFLLGFLLFLPFLIIDIVISSILMSMGMVMLPPVMISFPFKILLFVVVDGWKLIVQQVVVGYS